MMRFHCVACGEIAGDAYQAFCKCGSMIDVEYDSARVRLADSANPYVRFRDLLPLAATRDRLPSDARYSPAIHAKALGARFGLPKLYLKDETVLPTRSTKDRMAAVALGFLWERGVRSFCTSSTGNSSTSYASAIRAFPDMTLHLFTAEDFVERVQHADHPQVQHFGMRDASFVDAFNHAATYAAQHKLVSERGFFNLGRREGLKMAYFEATDQVPGGIDWYVQAVSSAMGVYGTYKGAKELKAIGHIERVPNPDDKRSYLISLSPDGQMLLKQARPRFRAFAESVEERLGQKRVDTLRGHLGELRDAIETELSSG